jgi:RNA polymerase sigma-70 factor (ECF subfamily)
MYMKNKADSEDMTQNTFMKLAMFSQNGDIFESHKHETAWLIKTAINLCKNSLKSLWNRRIAFDELIDSPGGGIPEPDETLVKLMKLPANLKNALYLHYYEGYSTAEIAVMMGKTEINVRGYLHRGRKALKKQIETEEEIYDY